MALAVSNASYRGLVSMVSDTGLACTGKARPEPSFQCALLSAEKFS